MELRLVLTVADFEEAIAFYRDALGLEELPATQPPPVSSRRAPT
jgi:catechol 2,3-dioxygenase-like lactoylglutathione lyase family enzyme